MGGHVEDVVYHDESAKLTIAKMRQALDILKGRKRFPSPVVNNKRVIVPCLAVPCPRCGADIGEKCIPHHRPLHSERARDAQAVQDAIEALTDED